MPDVTGLLAAPATVVGVLAFIVVAFMREWIVAGSRHRRDLATAETRYAEKAEEAEHWRDLALRGTTLAERAVEAVAPEANPEVA